jgi:hypothetical protein
MDNNRYGDEDKWKYIRGGTPNLELTHPISMQYPPLFPFSNFGENFFPD